MPTYHDGFMVFLCFFIFIKSTLIEENQGNISIYATVVMYMKSSIHFPNAVMKEVLSSSIWSNYRYHNVKLLLHLNSITLSTNVNSEIYWLLGVLLLMQYQQQYFNVDGLEWSLLKLLYNFIVVGWSFYKNNILRWSLLYMKYNL